MTETCEEIVSDAEVERVHAHANFGSMSKRQVVDEGVLKFAFGWSTGRTMMTILHEHGLIQRPKGYSSRLTKKGFRYLRAMFRGVPFDSILNIYSLRAALVAFNVALRRACITELHRPASGFSTVHWGYECRNCGHEWQRNEPERHRADCLARLDAGGGV